MWEHLYAYVEFIPDMLVVLVAHLLTLSIMDARSTIYWLCMWLHGATTHADTVSLIDADTYHTCGCVVHPHLLVVASLAATWEGCSYVYRQSVAPSLLLFY